MPYGGNIHATVGADLVQADVDAIVQGVAGSPGKTLADLHAPLAGVLECLLGSQNGLLTDVDATLSSGLIDEWGLPLLVAIDDSLASSLQNTALSEPWMATVQRAIEDTGLLYLFDQARQLPTLAVIHTELVNELFDQVNIQPFLQTIKYDLQSYLFNPMLNSSWLESLNNTTSTGLFDSMGNPWFQTLHFSLDDYLYDWTNSRPWLDTISTQLTSLLAIIEDVYDSTQHALITV